MDSETDRDYLTIDEFAARASLSPATVRRRIADGTLRHIQPGGKGTRILIPAFNPFTESTPAGAESPQIDLHTKEPKTRRGPKPGWMSIGTSTDIS